MTGEDLFSNAARKQVYRETSREAFEQFAHVSGDLDRAILKAIAAAGPNGITCEAIEIKIGRKHQAVSGNLRHLVEDGLVRFNGDFGKTAANRRAMLWELTPAALKAGPRASRKQPEVAG